MRDLALSRIYSVRKKLHWSCVDACNAAAATRRCAAGLASGKTAISTVLDQAALKAICKEAAAPSSSVDALDSAARQKQADSLVAKMLKLGLPETSAAAGTVALKAATPPTPPPVSAQQNSGDSKADGDFELLEPRLKISQIAGQTPVTERLSFSTTVVRG